MALSREKNMLFRNRRNCCCFNHPIPIWCPCARSVCRNEVINPTLTESFGFFNNTAVGTIGSDSTIPLNLVQIGGGGINTNGSGAILLSAGTYQVTYFANGTIPAGGTMSIKLRLNGFNVAGSVLTNSQSVGDVETLTQTLVLSIPQDGGILELVNNSNATTFTLASMFVRRI